MPMTRRLATKAVLMFFAASVVGIFVGHQGAAQSFTFSRGERVRIKGPTKPSDPKPSDMPLTVVAVGGDRMRVTGSALYVNDTPVRGFSEDFIARVVRTPGRTPQTVPPRHYFVMGEARINENVSEYWGVHSAVSLESAK